MVEIDTLLAEHHRVLRAVCDQHRREILVHVCFGAGCLRLRKMLGDIIAHQHALRAVRFLMVQRCRIAVRQCHINSSVQIDNTAYLAAFPIDRLIELSALCGHAGNGGNLSAGRISHEEHLRRIQLILIRMRAKETDGIFCVDDLRREMCDSAVTVFDDRNNVAALRQTGDHADLLVDILFHPAQIKQEKDYEAQRKEIERLTAWIEKWKNTPTKVAATRSKRMAIEHMVKIEKPRRFDTRTFHALFHPARESYTDVLTIKKLKIGYDTVLSEVSAVIKKAERIAIIGENGKGKSTLLKTVVGEINPLGGSYQFGNRVDFAYFDQHKAVNQKFDPEQTVLDYFWSLYPNLLRNDVRSALGAFLFSGEDVEKKMGQLSGGEKVRLELCRIFYTKPNFLILDEPTNHMDLAGKEALEKMLTSYEGTVLFVSHDRYFINQVATGILEFGESDVQFYGMNYAQYLEEIKRQTPGRETGNAGGAVRKPADVPTLDDVFDKKKYYNPGKILSRLKRQLEKYEEQLAESESRMSELQLEMMDPELSANYERLMELQTKIDEENQTQESLLERMMETELELEEMEASESASVIDKANYPQ